MSKASNFDAAQAAADAADARCNGAKGYHIRRLNALDRVVSIVRFNGSAIRC
jgi:hypothetical protein